LHRKNLKQAKAGRKNSRGVALVTSLLLLLLLTGMTVAMVLSANSDMLINGYYRGFRGSFYASDSALTVARQSMVNQLVAAGSTGFSVTAQPIPVGTEATVAANINTTYGAAYQSLNGGQAASSWPETYKIDTTGTSLSAPTCTVVGGGGTCAAPTGTVTGYQYNYSYTLRAFGRSTGNQVTTMSDSGTIKINVSGSAGTTTTSFAAYGMFINTYNICDGSTLVAGTISGPVFTNGSWNFGTSGSYIFTDKVGSAGSNFGYQFNGKCDQSSAVSDKSGSTTIAPTFQSGINLGAPTVPLPANDYNQQRAVLDGQGSGSTAPSNAEMNATLKNAAGTAWPVGGASSGVYIPYSVNATTGAKTFTGGGIYVQGNAAVTLAPASSGAAQVYTITQGSTVTTVTINNSANTTTITSGSSTQTMSGVPSQLDPTTGAFQRDATMLYVNGAITGLTGPGQGQAALSDNTALTIDAASNITVTGDLLYTSKPVTTTQNQIANMPADTLIPGSDHGQALGIFTSTGDVQMNNQQSNGNLEIDASIATISANGTGGLTNTGSTINTLTIIGGRIQNNIKNINTTTRNVFFDRRYAQNNFSPPWFPSTTVTATAGTNASYTPSVQRLKWLNNTSYY
jgi:Tfp pilus assembly protein PilX